MSDDPAYLADLVGVCDRFVAEVRLAIGTRPPSAPPSSAPSSTTARRDARTASSPTTSS